MDNPLRKIIPAKPDRRMECLEEMGKILKEYGGLESDIPVTRTESYWKLKSEYLALQSNYKRLESLKSE